MKLFWIFIGGFFFGMTPVFTPVHEIGHYLTATFLLADAYWVKFNEVHVSLGKGLRYTIFLYGGPLFSLVAQAGFIRLSYRWLEVMIFLWGALWFEYLGTFFGFDMTTIVSDYGAVNYFIYGFLGLIPLLAGAYFIALKDSGKLKDPKFLTDLKKKIKEGLGEKPS